MKIQILDLVEGARKAAGLTVIIDVFRAFTLACYAFDNNASDIIPVGDIDEAYLIKQQNPGFILMGERNTRMQEGFDYGNSPAQIEHVDFKGRTIIHTTSAGTQGLTNAINADEIITGSFVNAKAVARYILSKNPEELSLVAMGYEGRIPSDEDTLCAQYIQSIIEHKPFELEKVEEILRTGSGKRFFDPANQAWSPEGDFHLCMAFNRFDFVLRAEKKPDGLLYLVKIPF